MAVTIPRRRQTHRSPSSPQPGPENQIGRPRDSLTVPALKAGLVGSGSYLILYLLGLIPPLDNLAFTDLFIAAIPGFFFTGLGTGLLAAFQAQDLIKNDYLGGEVGWLAGFWAGILVGLGAMLLAAQGLLMVSTGQSLVGQFSLQQLAVWRVYGLLGPLALAGRVLGALVVYGLLGSLFLALFGAIGGSIYARLNGLD